MQSWKSECFFAGFCEHVSSMFNITHDILSWCVPPSRSYFNHLTQPVKMAAADDVTSTYSALIKRWAKITELITRLDDEQRAVRLALAHGQDKQSAPSKPNMPPWEAPVIWGLKEGTRDEWGAIETTENTRGDWLLYLWRCISSVMVYKIYSRCRL